MKTVINYDQEKLESEGLPEYIRDIETTPREPSITVTARPFAASGLGESPRANYTSDWVPPSQRDTGGFTRLPEPSTNLPKSDELEALWPGFHQDFMHTPRRSPSFYMMLGFLGGAIVSMVGVWAFAFIGGLFHHGPGSTKVEHKPAASQQVVETAGVNAVSNTVNNAAPLTPRGGDPKALLIPQHATVEVQAGDTMAAIAMREYGRVSPRMLDTIIKVNGLKNANFLSLGQKINLPNYQPITTTQAGSTSTTP